MNNSELIAKHLLESKAVKLNIKEPFTFVSGIKSPIYCDNRIMISNAKERNDIVKSFIENNNLNNFDIIAGTATAGIPWASFIADRSNKPMSYVRSKPKSYGANKQIEGANVCGKTILLIEDLISTGGSVLKAIDALKKEGAIKIVVAAIFTYNFKEAKENFKNKEISYSTLCDFNTLIKWAKNHDKLSEEDYQVALKWNHNPKDWFNIY